MERDYRIDIPCSKEALLEKIKQTAKPLEFSNQAYRETVLFTYAEENESLCISYAAGSMNGGGFEMLKMQIKSLGDHTILEGKFVPVPYVKRGAQIFLIAILFMAVFFSGGEALILAEVIVIVFLPLFLLYKNLSGILKNEEGRRLVFQYLEEELSAKIVASPEEE